MELAKAGALVLKALDSEVMGEPGGTPCPLLMALASAACPGPPTALADWVPVATTAAHHKLHSVNTHAAGLVEEDRVLRALPVQQWQEASNAQARQTWQRRLSPHAQRACRQ